MPRKRQQPARPGARGADELPRLVALLRAGRAGEAAVLGERIIALRPQDARALTYLGMARAMIGDASGAIESLERGVQIDPKNALAMVQLSNALRMDERLGEALEWAQRALEVDPTNELALGACAELLVMLDHADEACELLEPIINADRENGGSGGVGVAWGKVMRALGEAERAIDVVRAVCEDDRESADARSGAVFVLGDLLLASGRHDESFETFARANAMRGGAQGVGDAVRAMDAMRQGWTKESTARAPRADDAAVQRSRGLIFVVGMPRSGTTLVERVLDAHPQAVGVGESQCVGRVVAEIARGMGVGSASVIQTPSLLTSRVLTERGGQVIDALGARARRTDGGGAGSGGSGGGSGGVIVDKQPLNFLHLGVLGCMLPGAKVIHCVRDPRDTCLSCFFQDFGAGLGFSQGLDALGRYYNAQGALMHHWKSVLDIEIMDVVYESFVREPDEWQRKIVAFAGLEWDERCARFHESGRASSTASNEQVRREIHTGSIGRWKRFEHQLKPLLEALGKVH